LSALRQELLAWRFYHAFRTDPQSPLRRAQPGVFTPVLSHDGSDLAAALQTIIESGNSLAMRQAVNCAFPGAELRIDCGVSGFSVGLKMPEFVEPFSQAELSDGTLHYLCLLAALLSPRPPALLAINEPESSLHPGLYPALAKLIAAASQRTQVWLTTHAEPLAQLLNDLTYVEPIRLEKVDGETRIIGFSSLGIRAEDDETSNSTDE